MDRRKFFKNLAAGTAAVTVAATIPAAILKAAEEKVKEVTGDQLSKRREWNTGYSMWDSICFKGEPYWMAAIVGIDMIPEDATIILIPHRDDEGPEGEPKGARFERKLSWLKENTLLFRHKTESDNSEYGHYENDRIHGWED